MIKQFILPLYKNEQRPIAFLDEFYKLNALIDTGAVFPVWTAGEEILLDIGGEILAKDVTFGGFGGQSKGNLYKIHNVRIGELLFPEFAVVSSDNLGEVPFHIILSATVFSDLAYEIDDKVHRFTVKIPDGESYIRRLRLHDSNGKLYIMYQSDSGSIKT